MSKVLDKIFSLVFARALPEVNAPHKQRKNHLPLKAVNFGDLKRLSPIGKELGGERGIPVDLYYIRKFLQTYADDIKGNVLEFEDNYYTQEFGRRRATKSDIMNLAPSKCATIVGDITKADFIPANTFDCIIFTQTLFIIYDVRSALKHLYRILKPGGTLLITVPGISPRVDSANAKSDWHDCWRFTKPSLHQLLCEFFPKENVTSLSYGNVYVATAFLYGLSLDDLTQNELDFHDPQYEVTIGVRAVKK